MDVFTNQHILGFFLTGGASNLKPSLSLGGVVSTKEYRELRPIITSPIPGLQILQVFTSCGEGIATLEVDSSYSLVFTPPGADAGAPVRVEVGETKIIPGADTNKALIVKRYASDLDFMGKMTLTLVECLNGLVSMGNVADADRQSGKTYYRGFVLKNQGAMDIYDLQIWVELNAGLQSTYSFAKEDVGSDGTIQTIANENTAPTGMVFQEAMGWQNSFIVTESADLFLAGDEIGIWIKKVFPVAGVVRAQEEVLFRARFSVEA